MEFCESDGSTSVSMGVVAAGKRKKLDLSPVEPPEIMVCLSSDDEIMSSRRRSSARGRTGYRLRAKVRGPDKFKPEKKKNPGALDKRRMELENDVGTPGSAKQDREINGRSEGLFEEKKSWASKNLLESDEEVRQVRRRYAMENWDEATPSRRDPLKTEEEVKPSREHLVKNDETPTRDGKHLIQEDEVVHKNIKRRAVFLRGKVDRETNNKKGRASTPGLPVLKDLIQEINEKVPGMAKETTARSRGKKHTSRKKLRLSSPEEPDLDEELARLRDEVDEARKKLDQLRVTISELQRRKTVNQEARKRKAAVSRRKHAVSQPIKEEHRDNSRIQSDSSASNQSLVAMNPQKYMQDADEFTAKLQKEISRPFSLKELKDKLASVQVQKPVMRSRDFRGQRSRNFWSGKDGLSYLDHHPDFAAALKLAPDGKIQLRLLREFFFWLEHACMKGSYTPWNQKNRKATPKKDEVIYISD